MTDVKGQVYRFLQQQDMTIRELTIAVYPDKKGVDLQNNTAIKRAVYRLIKWGKVRKNGTKICDDGLERILFTVVR